MSHLKKNKLIALCFISISVSGQKVKNNSESLIDQSAQYLNVIDKINQLPEVKVLKEDVEKSRR